MYFPAYIGKAANMDGMSFRLDVLVNWGGGPKVFPWPVPKGLSQFPDVFLLTTSLDAFKPAYNPTLLGPSVLVLWGHQ